MGVGVMRAQCLAAALALLLALAHPATAQDLASPIVGVWKLTSFARKEIGSAKVVEVYGEDPRGYRIHTRGGHAFYMFFSKDRKAPIGAITDSDRIELYKTMTTAGGTFKVDGKKFHFQPEVSSGQSLTGFSYEFEITGMTLKMMTEPRKNPSGGPDFFFISSYERAE